jgi:polyisoprenoid-binding protein YceI
MNARGSPQTRTFDGMTIPVPGVYDVDPVHSFVVFRVRHLVVGKVRGRFDSFEGDLTIVEDPEQLFGAFEVSFATASVDTQVEMRDQDIRSPRFFDAEAFPTATLRGGRARRMAGSRWTVEAELTIREVTHPVSLEVAVRGALDAHGKTKAALAVTTELQRSDFGLTTELLPESGSPGTGPDVEISVDVEAFLR